uniref:Enoyl-CoA hydratase domain-containing protein 3, mitochondrial n=1 Tax=Meloidogyne hapla TaxID=6305 RepID=A0A1I8BFY5_MELHA
MNIITPILHLRCSFSSLNAKLFSSTSLLSTIIEPKEKNSEPLIKQEWHLDGKVARLILNCAKRRNALSLDLMETLRKELRELDSNMKVRTIIIASEGNVFSAGHDLNELTAESGPSSHKRVFNKCVELMETIQNISLPVIAEVDGLVTAAATQLVATCDVVVATRRSTFSCPGIKIGLFCNTPGIALARNLPRKLAMDMLLTAREITAEEALNFGLISRILEDGKAKNEALAISEEICKYSRHICGLGKSFFYTQIEQNINTANKQGATTMCNNLKLPDAKEGISAFLEKRKPKWVE